MLKCAGKRASVMGTEKPDRIKLGGKNGRVVASLGGRDRIIGSGKRDLICTGGGGDVVAAGGGADRVAAGAGQDRALGGGGADLLLGGKDADAVSGGAGPDRLLPGGAKDHASGGRGTDTLVGARGNDRLRGGADGDAVIGSIGNDRLRGGGGNDQLIGEDGVDFINGGDGDDGIVGGSGPDQVDGGGGSDRVDGGPGGDRGTAGDGEDLMIGAGGGDRFDGGRGGDRIYGGLVDDEMFGGPGADLLVGGHGVDALHGNDGDDFLRGDSNRDIHYGDAGEDTVSYATATPPGPGGIEGVNVNLAIEEGLEDEPQAIIIGDYRPPEPLYGVESVVGSNYDDVLQGRGTGTVRGLGGSEACSGFLVQDCGGAPAPSVTLDPIGIDPGLLVRGGPADEADTLAVSATADTYVVTGAGPLSAGAGCLNNTANQVSCAKPPSPLGYVAVWGGGGSDQLSLAQGFPDQAVIVLDGGTGSDTITGSSGDEILRAGPDGADDLNGRAGDDALFSGPGPDTLDGGDGNDQLVTTDACGGHDFKGGGGDGDIAGFAQSIEQGVIATLGGTAIGRSQSPCPPTHVRADNEVLEGTQHADILYGNGKDNALILGNESDDILYGYGGADVLRGEQGQDALYGGGGADVLEAFDRRRDIALHCGPGGNKVIRDSFDPPGANCPVSTPPAKGNGKKGGKGRKKGGGKRKR